MALEKVFGPVQQAAKKSPNSTLLIRLNQCVTEMKAGFHAHFMKLLAQEITRKELAHKDISKIVKDYLNPFEIVEETNRIGFEKIVQFGKQQKRERKTVFAEDIERHYWQCLNHLAQTEWKLILIFTSIQGFSETAQQFAIKFLEGYKGTILLFGGPDRGSLSSVLTETGISDYYPCCYLDIKPSKINSRGEKMTIAEAILSSLAKAPQYFRYFKFELQAQVEGKDLPGRAARKFDLAVLGHLEMRDDYPKRICTNYDCAILIAQLKEPVERAAVLYDLCNAAYELREGMNIEGGRRFEPWDTYLFLRVPSVLDSVVESYEHQGYMNVFLLLPDGRYHNLSPHKWMDDAVLEDISSRIGRKAI